MFPVLLEIGPFSIHTYGLLVALGFIAGIALALHLGKSEEFARDTILDIGFYILVSSIIGSRLLYVLIEYKYFSDNPLEIFQIWEGGLVFYGGLLLAIPVLMTYFRQHGLEPWKTLDLFAPSMALGHAIGRIGCFSAGCCYGKPTTLPWGVTFLHPESMAITGIALHPTQLYESGAELGIFIFLMLFRSRKRFHGQLVWLYVLLYSAARFTIEFFRGDAERGFIFNTLSSAQGISLILFLTAFYFLNSRKRTLNI
jgi:phosphatidylglycerol:prolipoprotein diacylglycerol transferase